MSNDTDSQGAKLEERLNVLGDISAILQGYDHKTFESAKTALRAINEYIKINASY